MQLNTPRRRWAGALLALACLSPAPGLWLAQAQTNSLTPAAVGPNYQVWSFGAAKTPVVQLETGMHYFDPQSQTYLPSIPALSPGSDGQSFVATQVQHRLRLSYQLNVAGAVSVRMDGGLALDSTPVALALYEPSSGNFAIIGTLTNSTALQISSNQVLYLDVFGAAASGVCCDFRYTLQKGTLAQDCIVTGSLDPRNWGFSTNCWVQVLTEFYGDVPEPDQRSLPAGEAITAPGLNDHMLGFGQFVMAAGRAYTEPTAALPTGASVTATKQWVAAKRTFLVESIPYAKLMTQFLALPECGPGGGQAALDPGAALNDAYASIPQPPERAELAQAMTEGGGLIAQEAGRKPEDTGWGRRPPWTIGWLEGGKGGVVYRLRSQYQPRHQRLILVLELHELPDLRRRLHQRHGYVREHDPQI